MQIGYFLFCDFASQLWSDFDLCLSRSGWPADVPVEFDSYKRAQENAWLCVAENVSCNLSPIPGPADNWVGPNNP